MVDYEIKTHYKFDWLGKQHLDGCVFKEGKPIFAYEYDGEQHFIPVKFGGISDKRARKNLKHVKELDRRKNKLCKENNLPLVRFSYKEVDRKLKQIPEEIIYKKLEKLCQRK